MNSSRGIEKRGVTLLAIPCERIDKNNENLPGNSVGYSRCGTSQNVAVTSCESMKR